MSAPRRAVTTLPLPAVSPFAREAPAPLVLVLPEPPTVNRMVWLAKRTTRRGPAGKWLQRPVSRYWVEEQDYFNACLSVWAAIPLAARRGLPWARWRIVSAHFRLHQRRDWVELSAGLKWPVDWLKHAGIVADDSPDHLAPTPTPTQEVDQRNRGVVLTIAPLDTITLTPEG